MAFPDGLLFISVSRIFWHNVTCQLTLIMKVCLGRRNKHVRRELGFLFGTQGRVGFCVSFPSLYIHFGHCSFMTPVESPPLPALHSPLVTFAQHLCRDIAVTVNKMIFMHRYLQLYSNLQIIVNIILTSFLITDLYIVVVCSCLG